MINNITGMLSLQGYLDLHLTAFCDKIYKGWAIAYLCFIENLGGIFMFLTNTTVTVGELQRVANMASTSTVSSITASLYGILTIVGFWILFESKGEKGWKAIIPIYSTYIAYKLFYKKSKFWTIFICWILFFFAIMYLAFLGLIAQRSLSDVMGIAGLISLAVIFITLLTILVISILFDISICKKYNMGVLFTLGMIFFSPIFLCILAYEVKKGRAVEKK